MMPKYKEELNQNGKVWLDYENNKFDLSLFLQKLNDKISKELDREHQIGHSFLMKVKNSVELKRAWENKIMPLLQEYFYADYDTLSKIIGSNSAYLKKENENNWQLNMKENDKNFETEFQKIYDFVIGKKSINELNRVSPT